MQTNNPTSDKTQTTQAILRGLSMLIRGKDQVLKDCLTCLIAGGHLLIEDIPGVGKTTLAYALARSMGGSFSRIQFTSDLLPSDVLGVSIYKDSSNSFEFHPGPIFANVVLADEINRTTPKTQSSLLECMERTSISVETETLELPRPFMVVATQNPLDYEGTFPLPENQLDRFLMRISMGYPEREYEKLILEHPNHHYDDIQMEPVATTHELLQLQEQCKEVFVESSVLDYLLNWVEATRNHPDFKVGVSTRGAIALKRASQARALIEGRSFVIPRDVEDSLIPVCAHRIIGHSATTHEALPAIENALRELSEQIPAPV